MTLKRKKPPVHVSDQEIINAVEDANGSYRLAAEKLRISYGTVVCRAKRNPEIERAKLDACAEMVSIAEDNIYNALLEGDLPTSRFVAERLDPDKWAKKTQVTNKTDDYPTNQEWE